MPAQRRALLDGREGGRWRQDGFGLRGVGLALVVLREGRTALRTLVLHEGRTALAYAV